MNVLLVGYRGSGKSSVGMLLARDLGWGFIDLDAVIVERAGRSISEIFAADGEEGFRRLEREALESVRKIKDHVIALGGGALDEPGSRALARRLGKLVWLRAPPAVLWARISRDDATRRNRPDLTRTGGLAEIETVLPRREPIYAQAAHHVVDTMQMTPAQVAETIGLWLRANDSTHE